MQAATAVQELMDKQAIRDLQCCYAFAIDAGDYEQLNVIFTPDAVGDYGRAGYVTGVEAIKETCRRALSPLTSAQHVNSGHLAEIDGDVAVARCYLHVHLQKENTDGGDYYEMGGRYDDELVRTSDGWRIKRRKLTIFWAKGNPSVRW